MELYFRGVDEKSSASAWKGLAPRPLGTDYFRIEVAYPGIGVWMDHEHFTTPRGRGGAIMPPMSMGGYMRPAPGARVG